MQRTALIFSLTMLMIMHPGGPASAQDWGEYVNIEERFGINIPGEPARTQETFRTASGLDFPAQVFTAFDGAGTYIVTVVRYSDLNHELFQTLLDDAVEAIRNRGGDVTYEGFNIYDGMDTISLQITNEDTSRSFYAITLPPRPSLTERLYIIEGRVDAGSGTFSAIALYRRHRWRAHSLQRRYRGNAFPRYSGFGRTAACRARLQHRAALHSGKGRAGGIGERAAPLRPNPNRPGRLARWRRWAPIGCGCSRQCRWLRSASVACADNRYAFLRSHKFRCRARASRNP